MIRIAIVEDDDAYCRQLVDFLKRYESESGESFRLSLFSDGMEIVQDYRSEYDIILMDIQMPEMDGIRTSELIRKIPRYVDTPIIAVTAHAINGERERLLRAGMDDYLAKPIDENMLRQLLARYYRAPNETNSPAAAASLETDSDLTLDWDMALRQAANKEDLARDLLQMLLEFLPQVKTQVEAALEGNQDPAIVDIIHKLHGSCSYSGLPRLKRLCRYIEQQLRHEIAVGDLEPEWMELLDEIENVEKAAQEKLNG